VDVVFSSWRMMIGPRAMSPDQVAYWEGIAAKVSAQKEWISDLERNSLVPGYMNSSATRKLLAQQAEQLRSILTDLGLAK